jgi:hypothetical protein
MWVFVWIVCGSRLLARADWFMTQSALDSNNREGPVRHVLWECFATIIIAAAVLAVVLALAVAVTALPFILPLAYMVWHWRCAREHSSEPIVLIEACEVASRAWARPNGADLTIARVDAD